jgi:hypothetical protein
VTKSGRNKDDNFTAFWIFGLNRFDQQCIPVLASATTPVRNLRKDADTKKKSRSSSSVRSTLGKYFGIESGLC